jgi:hypothetical protein
LVRGYRCKISAGKGKRKYMIKNYINSFSIAIAEMDQEKFTS